MTTSAWEQRREQIAVEHQATKRFLKTVLVFLLVWPPISNLMGCAVQEILKALEFGRFHGISGDDLLTLVLFSYLPIGIILGAVLGIAIAWIQTRSRRLNLVYVGLVLLLASSTVPLVFLDKDVSTRDALIGHGVNLGATLLCWMLVVRWRDQAHQAEV
jgi:hypothetical protein